MATTPVSTSTTSTTSTANSTTAAQLQASKKSSAQKILSSLGAGSGVDVASLAQNLVDAERLPREKIINDKIAKNDAKVSGMSAVMFMMSEFQKALTAVKDRNSFNNLTVSNSDTSQVNITANNTAAVGTHQIQVKTISQPQKSLSSPKTSGSTLLGSGNTGLVLTLTPSNGGQSKVIQLQTGAFGGTAGAGGNTLTGMQFGTTPSVNDFKNFSVNIGGVQRDILPLPQTADFAGLAQDIQKKLRALDGNSTDISVSYDSTTGELAVSSASGKSITGISLTPQTYDDTLDGAAKAINNANQGYSAQVINDGTSSKLVITGANGGDQSFTVTSNNSLVSFDVDPDDSTKTKLLQKATDASVVVNGVTYTRKTNSINDILTGVTIDLRFPSANNTPSTVVLSRDTAALKTNLSALVTAYNDLNNIIKETTNPKSTLETYGATLVGNSAVRLVQSQIRSAFFSTSSTPSGDYKSLTQLGFNLDQTGVLSLDSSKLDTAVQNGLDDIAKMFSGGFNNLSKYAKLPAGIAGDTLRTLGNLLDPKGPFATQTNNANTENSKYKEQLSQLETRMNMLLTRYQKQFAAMDSMVGSSNSQRTSLKTTFDGMMSMYTNKN